jgi:hypothetical protein
MQRRTLVLKTICVGLAVLWVTSCALQQAPPNTPPEKPNFVSLDPQNWYIFYSGGMPDHPTADSLGAWSFDFPSFESGGHVNYVQTPFNATKTLHNVTVTFVVDSDAPQYHVMDSTDHPPATVHFFFEIQNDDLVEADGRWWADPSKYNLGSYDNHVITITVPLTPDCWTDVFGKSTSTSFYASLAKVGWIGVTFGGQDFWGHGVALAGGRSKYVLQNFYVD